MSFFLHALKIEFLGLFRSRRYVAGLLLLILGLGIFGSLLPEQELLPAVPVGWAMPEDCRYGQELLSLLRTQEGLVQFIPTTEEDLRANVASGKWACGFVLGEDFDARVSRMRCRGIFTLVHGQDSAIQGLVSEAVSSAMLVMLSEKIGREYLAAAGVEAPDEGWILAESSRMEVEPVYEGKLGLEPMAVGFGENLIQAITGGALLLLAIAFGDDLSLRRKKDSYLRIAAVRGHFAMLMPALACRFVMLFTLGALCYPGDIVPLLALCLCLTGLMALLAELPGGWSGPVLPFLPPVLLVLCPVLFDVSALMPQLKPICDLISLTYYLRGEVLPNLIMAAVLAALAVFIGKNKRPA